VPLKLSTSGLAAGSRAALGIATRRYVFGGPRLLVLDICEACDTDCIMCEEHSPLLRPDVQTSANRSTQAASQPPRYADRGMLESIVRESARAGTHKVVLGESGEPIIHPHFDRLLDLTVQQGMTPIVMTNGLALDERRASRWAPMAAYYRFSLHAGDVDTWLRIHPGGSSAQWERLSRVIRVLVREGKSTVVAMHVLQKANFRGIQQMIEHAKEHGIRQVVFSPVRGTGCLAQVLLAEEEESWLRRELQRCIPLAQSLGIRTNARQYLDTGLHVTSGQHQTASVYRRVPCYVGWIQSFVLADGTAIPCEASNRTMGNMHEQSFLDIWRSPRYQEFRREAITLPERGEPVKGCACDHCSLVRSNLKTWNLLHMRLSQSDLGWLRTRL